MSVFCVVAVHDSALDAFSRPFFTPTTAAAVRSFTDEVNRGSSDNPLHVHPEDYTLYEVAKWDESTGVFESIVPRTMLVRGKMFRGRRVKMAERTAFTVLREMAVVKSQVKDPLLRELMLEPLQKELEIRARAVAAQGNLELGTPVPNDSQRPKK